MSSATFLVGDVFDRMAELPDASVDLVATSPPFWKQRAYLLADHPMKPFEIGQEATPGEFLSTLLALTREWRRVLAPHGSICVELGDTYSGSGGAGGDYAEGGMREGQPVFRQQRNRPRDTRSGRAETATAHTPRPEQAGGNGWPLAKSLTGIPTLYAWSLAYGRNLLDNDDTLEPWRIRNVIAWHRPNPPVGALGDKVRPSTSYVTVACTSAKRWFDLDEERSAHKADPEKYSGNGYSKGSPEGIPGNESMPGNPAGAPPLDCWTIPTAPYSGSHYATFPPALPRKLINLMCPRQVCTVCGEPRRRRLHDAEPWRLQPVLAAHIKERREALGINSGDINERLGYKEIAKNWERTDPHGAAVPGPKDWAIIKPWLGLSDDFDDFVLGRQNSTVEYVANGKPLGLDERRDDYGRGGLGLPDGTLKADRRAPDEWTDCGHHSFRRGLTLDPFAGSGTTLMAASELGRDSIGIDLDDRNLDLARERCGLFLEVGA